MFNPWGGDTRRRAGRAPAFRARWEEPLRWNRAAALSGERPRVLCAGPVDWLDPSLPPARLSRLLRLMRRTPHLEWVLPVIRPWHWEGRMRAVLARGLPSAAARWLSGWLSGRSVPAHVRVGTLIRSQREAEALVPHLLAIPAARRFVLCRASGPIDLSALDRGDGERRGVLGKDGEGGAVIHQVICGPSPDPAWTQSLRARCAAAGAVFSAL